MSLRLVRTLLFCASVLSLTGCEGAVSGIISQLFTLALHGESVTLAAGGEPGPLRVTVFRIGSFRGNVSFEIRDLPDGVRFTTEYDNDAVNDDGRIDAISFATIYLEADASALRGSSDVTLVGISPEGVTFEQDPPLNFTIIVTDADP